MSELIPVILCGGSGTRMWPLSRTMYPKQLLGFGNDASLLQATARRALSVTSARPVVVCNEEHRFLVAEQFREIGAEPCIVLEPDGRNTAPAVAVAALAAGVDDDDILLVLPADHVIDDLPWFGASVRKGVDAARSGKLVTFGIVPDRPHTGYGYIVAGAVQRDAYAVDAFVEKPDAVRARELIGAGNCYWNSGIFMFSARALFDELGRHAPDILAAVQDAAGRLTRDMGFLRPDADAFRACRAESIDYAVMEHTASAVVVPLGARWSDVGSWSSLRDLLPSDNSGNATVGDVIAEDCVDCLFYSTGRLVAAKGLTGVAVVDTADAVLVVPLDKSEEVKSLVARLELEGRGERIQHRQIFRPWGSYASTDAGPRFQVKRLIVNPGAQLSLQLHRHRAEHWVVVQGVARITRGDEIFDLHEDQSTYIPVGVKHRIENPGTEPLHIIEVQSGGYLGEDDIVRFEDVYGRSGDGK